MASVARVCAAASDSRRRPSSACVASTLLRRAADLPGEPCDALAPVRRAAQRRRQLLLGRGGLGLCRLAGDDGALQAGAREVDLGRQLGLGDAHALGLPREVVGVGPASGALGSGDAQQAHAVRGER